MPPELLTVSEIVNLRGETLYRVIDDDKGREEVVNSYEIKGEGAGLHVPQEKIEIIHR